MPIDARQCPSCKTRLAVRDGREARCPRCGSMVAPPQPVRAAASPPPPKPQTPGLPSPAKLNRTCSPPPRSPAGDDSDDLIASLARLVSEATCLRCGQSVPTGTFTCDACQASRTEKEQHEQQTAIERIRSTASSSTMWVARRPGRLRPPASSGWSSRLASLAGVALLLMLAVMGFSWASHFFDTMMIGARTQHEISDAEAHYLNAKYLSLDAERVLSYIASFESVARRATTPCDGLRCCDVETDRAPWHLEGGRLSPEGQEPVRREEASLPTMWFRELGVRGYFRDPRDRPPPLHIKSVVFREPGGVSWTVSDPAAARSLLNVAIMLGTKEFVGDLTLLMNCPRGSLGYSVVFPALNQRLPIDDKIRLSSEGPADARIMAAEMLASTLPTLPCDATDLPISADRYERLIASLANKCSIAEKTLILRQTEAEASNTPGRGSPP